MPASLIDGRALAKAIMERAARERATLDFAPGLAVVLVGDDAASHLYVNLKEKACRAAGIAFERLYFKADASQAIVVRAIQNLNRRNDVDAILVQLPLPPQLDEDAVIRAIDPAKDVDGFHPESLAALRRGHPHVVPGLAAGILALAKAPGEPLKGKSALVIANSPTFFEPLDIVLGAAGMRTAYMPPTPDAAAKAQNADLLIVAIGKAGAITSDMVKPGAIVIDVGTNRVDGKTVGDADPSVMNVAGHVTPVPGGVGPMTVAMLVHNAVALAERRRG